MGWFLFLSVRACDFIEYSSFLLDKEIFGYKFTVVFFYFSYLYCIIIWKYLEKHWLLLFFCMLCSFIKVKLGKYYLMVFVCFLFQFTAVVTFFIPLFRYVRYSFFKVFLLMLISIDNIQLFVTCLRGTYAESYDGAEIWIV